jgi:hypothetical protein
MRHPTRPCSWVKPPRWRSGSMVDQDRFGISDALCAKIAPLLPGKSSDGGVTAKDNRPSWRRSSAGSMLARCRGTPVAWI